MERFEAYAVADAFYEGIIADVFGLRMMSELGADVAHVEWDQVTGECMRLWVHPELRRQGVATRLWRRAQTLGAVHSMDRTVDGQAWALSLGDELPEWHRV